MSIKAVSSELLERFVAAENSRDAGAVAALLTEDVVLDAPVLGLRVDGREQVEAFFADHFARNPSAHVTVHEAAFAEDLAMYWGTSPHDVGAEFHGQPARAGAYEAPGFSIVRFRGERISSLTVFADIISICRQADASVDALVTTVLGGPGAALDQPRGGTP